MRWTTVARGFLCVTGMLPLLACSTAEQNDPPRREALTPQVEAPKPRTVTAPFVRADPSSPFCTAALFYTDEAGAQGMAGSPGFKRTPSGLVRNATGVIDVGVKCQDKLLEGVTASSRNYVVGEIGSRYTIVVRNGKASRIECVISVDGMDVLDGKPASFSKRGYIVDPLDTIEIDGFKLNSTTPEPFRFKRTGGTGNNAGVIGFAVFHEKGSDPFK